MTFPPTFLLLQQEGHLIGAFLAQGLTSLRAAGAHDKGALYRASFQLSIGIERLMKVTAVINHMGLNFGIPPSGQEIKNFGHDFAKLSDAMKTISSKIVGDPFSTALGDQLNRRIFDLLGEFGKGDIRYFNLQALASGQSASDPLSKWHGLLDEVIVQDVPARKKMKASRDGLVFGSLLDQHAFVLQHDLQGKALSARTGIERHGLESEATRFVVWRVMQILYSLKQLLNQAQDAAIYGVPPVGGMPRVPYMHEFLDFVTHEWAFVKNKKKWP